MVVGGQAAGQRQTLNRKDAKIAKIFLTFSINMVARRVKGFVGSMAARTPEDGGQRTDNLNRKDAKVAKIFK